MKYTKVKLKKEFEVLQIEGEGIIHTYSPETNTFEVIFRKTLYKFNQSEEWFLEHFVILENGLKVEILNYIDLFKIESENRIEKAKEWLLKELETATLKKQLHSIELTISDDINLIFHMSENKLVFSKELRTHLLYEFLTNHNEIDHLERLIYFEFFSQPSFMFFITF